MPVFQPITYSTNYTPQELQAVTAALVAADSGISVIDGSVALHLSGPDTVNFYDGSLVLDPAQPTSIGAGLLLTSGGTPGVANSMEWYGFDNSGFTGFDNGDVDIDAVVNTVFATVSYDATWLSFDFTVADPTATSITFDLVFGSDEYPEWVDLFVDSAIVMVNGVNYALFNHDPMHPLSVISPNLAAGYFQDNATGLLPIEYDGVSHTLRLVAPVNAGPGTVNHLKIAIADTGDHILDSGVFIANLRAGNLPGSGVVSPGSAGTSGNDTCSGSAQDEVFELLGGDDLVYAAGGDDIVACGPGNDTAYGGSGADQLQGGAGDDHLDGGDGDDTASFAGPMAQYAFTYDGATGSVTLGDLGGGDGIDTLLGIEWAQFSNGLYQITPAGLVPASTGGGGATNMPATVVVTGTAAPDKTLKAVCSDPDGIASPISYQWLTSADGGASWNPIAGATDSSYVVTALDLGQSIGVSVSFVDLTGQAESAISAPKTIAEANGDLAVTLLNLDAPPGATVINPLTTLVKAAITLGQSPNLAVQLVKHMLGLPESVQPLSYDAWPVLQAQPSDPVALQVEKVAVQVAILTSLSDDDQGLNLALALIDGAAAGHAPFDLASLDDLALILGLAPDPLLQPLAEIRDRNRSMSEALADGGDWTVIEQEWQDLLSIQDGIASTSIADLSIAINQAPVGTPPVSFDGLQDQPFVIDAAALLAGYSDPEGGALELLSVSADLGNVMLDGGTWTFQPPGGYVGPVELSFTVADAAGATTTGSTLLLIAEDPAINHPASGLPLIVGTATEDQVLGVSTAGIADSDGLPDTFDYQWLRDGIEVPGATSASYVLGDADVDAHIGLRLGFTDGKGHAELLFAVSSGPVANVDDPTTGTVLVVGTPQVGSPLSADTSGLADVDGAFSSQFQWQARPGDGSASWTDIAGASAATLTPGADLAGYSLRVVVLTTDVRGGSTQLQSDFVTLPPNHLALTGTAAADTLQGGAGNDTLTGLAGRDLLLGAGGADVLNGGADVDTMDGGHGSDLYLVANASEHAAAEIADSGTLAGDIDELRFTASRSKALVLRAGDTGLERVVIGTGSGAVADTHGTAGLDVNAAALGNAITLIGNDGPNRLIGGAFADTLVGGRGADSLTGGGGADHFVFDHLPAPRTHDTLLDFLPGTDKLALVASVFDALGGSLQPGQFYAAAGAKAGHDADDRLVYDTSKGYVYYDADGNGPIGAVQLALVGSQQHPTLAIGDFELISVGP